MIKLITFANDAMSQSAELCVTSALANGCDQARCFRPINFDPQFVQFNRDILTQPRGVGYWLFKPYFTYLSILEMQEGDILIYSDAGIKWIENVSHIIEAMDQDIFLFSNGHRHIDWCKADVLKIIGKDINGDYQQAQASVIFFKVSQNTKNFVKEWLTYCQLPGFIDDSPSKLPNHPEFSEHRHDQAILTCLQIKYEYKLHWWADKLWYESQRYRWANDKYPSMFEHHRKRDIGKGNGTDPEW